MEEQTRPQLDRAFQAELRRLYGGGIKVPCPKCGYNLRGLTGGAGQRCPECGRRIGDLLRLADLHPERLRAMIRQRRLRTLLRVAKAIAAVTVTAAIGTCCWFLWPR